MGGNIAENCSWFSGSCSAYRELLIHCWCINTNLFVSGLDFKYHPLVDMTFYACLTPLFNAQYVQVQGNVYF